MAGIKGVAGCMVLLGCQPPPLIRNKIRGGIKIQLSPYEQIAK